MSSPVSVAVSVAVSCRSTETLPLHAASSSVRTAVRSAVSWSAHNRAMIRLRSTHDDHPASLSSRTTRHPSTIEAACARHSLDDVARLASHDHFDRSPSLQLHLDDGVWHFLGCGQTAAVVDWVCQSKGLGWRQGRSASSTRAACSDARAPHTSRRPRAGTLLQVDFRREGTSRLTPRLSR